MIHTLHGYDKPIWFGINYDLANPIMDTCGYVVTDIGDYQYSEDQSVIFSSLSRILNAYHANPELKAWFSSHHIMVLKFIPLKNKTHDFGNATHGIIFNNQEDAVMFKLMWGSAV